jgi:hypothetical protein
VARLKRDFRAGTLVTGGVLSGVGRSLDSTFAPRLARHAELLGADLVATTSDRVYSLLANAALTDVVGDSGAVLLRQRSSARYFQRPDRGAGSGGFLSNRLDSSAKALRGAGLYVRVAKETGDWTWETALNTRTPGYETNDYAFQRNADYVWLSANLNRFYSKRTRWFQNAFVIAGGQTQQNYEGDRLMSQLHGFVAVTTHQFWNASASYIHRPSVLDDKALRGGPVVGTPLGHFTFANLSTDSRHTLVGNTSLSAYWDSRGDWNPSAYVGVTYNAAPNVRLSFGPSWNRLRGHAQYITSVPDTTAKAFYGVRYVLAGSEQRTLGLDTRVSWTFNPRTTLELYAQPFFASGRFFDFNEYAAPRHAALSVYGKDRGTIVATRGADGIVTQYVVDPDGTGPAAAFTLANPDFTNRSLRGNAVFRWEYRPGSLLYVAWTQQRFDQSPFGDLQFARDRQALFGTRPNNVFLIKASYWLPM